MKAHYRTLMALALFMLALNIAALAQDFSPEIRAQIPFRFYAGGKVLPAGSYTLAISRQNHNVAIFQRNGVGTFLLGSPHDGSTKGKVLLTFRADEEGAYVLQQVQEPDLGVSFNAGKISARLAKNWGAADTQVVLASLVK